MDILSKVKENLDVIRDRKFINDDFMLNNDCARELYHESAEKMPIIDYHCHLVPEMIAGNHRFKDLTEVWLGGDHYKWRAMRGNGVPEEFITGKRSSYEKFEKWAETVPYTMRNPLYHWTHLELARVFGIYDLLNPQTARAIYDECTEKLQTEEYRGQALMKRFNVKVVCTTDDPVDSLEYHRYIAEHPFGVRVLPAWRPDKSMAIEKPGYVQYIGKLSEVSGVAITGYQDLLDALKKRHDFFDSMGCRLSDHGLETFYAEDFEMEEIDAIFIDEIRKAGLYGEIWQALADLLPVKSVGVQGDERTYREVCTLRAVTSADAMTADWYRLPYDVMQRCASRICNEVSAVNRVLYDITSKPPATIEWE